MPKMSFSEAKQRCQVHGMRLSMRDGEFRVSYPEDKDDEAAAYYTDDPEDAALTASAMRKRRAAINK